MKKLEINIKDLKYNLDLLKKHSENTQIIAVVKANGMGFDLIKYSKFLTDNGIDFLAVATTKEAIALREEGIDTKILMLSEVYSEEELEFLVKNDIILTVGSLVQKEKIERIAKKLNKIANAHVKIDTGFGRYGFIYLNEYDILEAVKNSENLMISGIYTHFSKAINCNWTNIQFQRFKNLVLKAKEINENLIAHCSNSTAFLLYPEMNLDAVRLRLMYSVDEF